MECKCIKCGHVWFSRSEKRTRQCPKCGTSNWDGSYAPEYPFMGIEIGQTILIPWKPESQRHENYKISKALGAFCQRTKRTFKRRPIPRGFEITRLT